MTHTNKSSQQSFLKVVKRTSQNHSDFEHLKTTVELVWNESERAKGLHDLHAAAQAFQAMIALDAAKHPQPDERQLRKYRQLQVHAERLESLVDWLEGMTNPTQDQE